MSESPIFLKKGIHVARVVSASPALLAELSTDAETVLRTEAEWKPISVAEWQEKLLEKLNLDGLSNWTPQNAAAAQDLVLAFHDIFMLEVAPVWLSMSSVSLTVSPSKSGSGI